MKKIIKKMMKCSICGASACFGFGVTVDGIRMGDVGDWRCSEHHPQQKARYTREEWKKAREEGRLYPDSPPGEWREPNDIIEELRRINQSRK